MSGARAPSVAATSAGLLVPFSVSAFVILASLCIVDAEFIWVSANSPVLLAIARSTSRPLIISAWLGGLVTTVGGTGQIAYLGTATVPLEVLVIPVIFACALSLGAFFSARPLSPGSDLRGIYLPIEAGVGLLLVGILLFGLRFSSGIPLIMGNEARLDGVANVSPLLGLLSGTVAIAAAFTRTRPSPAVLILKVILLIAVLGSASRLLFLVVAVGIVSTSYTGRRSTAEGKVIRTSLFVLCIIALAFIYRVRTPDSVKAVESYRGDSLPPVLSLVSDWFGTGMFLSARNGLSVFQVSDALSLEPPGGFIGGGFVHGVLLGSAGGDPERWLTVALGFDSRAVGATATPIWAGATLDFGLVGMAMVALVLGSLAGLLARRISSIRIFLGLAILLSFYGSYLISAQFTSTLVCLVMCHLLFNRSDASDEGLVESLRNEIPSARCAAGSPRGLRR